MAIEKVKELLKAVNIDPKAQEALQGIAKPKGKEGVIRYYAEAAKLLGYEVTETDIREEIEEQIKELAKRTEKAAEGIQGISDDALAQVAGGDSSNDVCGWWLYDDCGDLYVERVRDCQIFGY